MSRMPTTSLSRIISSFISPWLQVSARAGRIALRCILFAPRQGMHVDTVGVMEKFPFRSVYVALRTVKKRL